MAPRKGREREESLADGTPRAAPRIRRRWNEGAADAFAGVLDHYLYCPGYPGSSTLPAYGQSSSQVANSLLPGAQNCTHVGIQNGTVRDRGREPFGRRFADRSIVGSEGGSGYSVVSTQRGRRSVREREEG